MLEKYSKTAGQRKFGDDEFKVILNLLDCTIFSSCLSTEKEKVRVYVHY